MKATPKPKVPDRLSVRAFAAAAGIPRTNLQRLIKDRIVPVGPDGKVPTEAGMAAVRAYKNGSREKKAETTSRAIATYDIKEAMLRAQLREREAKADARELEVRQTRGELVPVVEAQADAMRAGEVIRTSLLALPARISLQLEDLVARSPGAARAPQIEALVADEINAVLDQLHKTTFRGEDP